MAASVTVEIEMPDGWEEIKYRKDCIGVCKIFWIARIESNLLRPQSERKRRDWSIWRNGSLCYVCKHGGLVKTWRSNERYPGATEVSGHPTLILAIRREEILLGRHPSPEQPRADV